ncbi:MAG TPA: alpha-amylase family glycosyl hydrolase [Blastocatellia bacterium]|nr:alpha-amylase family glycosyl hydrolase [Blastocatellia bacterium]
MRIYEINTRAHCSCFDEITVSELDGLARLGFDAIWLMGVWQISDGATRISKIVSEDLEGSPFAVCDYVVSPALGGEIQFSALVDRAHKAGLLVIVDFVSNHMALDSPWINEDPRLFVTSQPGARRQAIREFFLHPSGQLVAFGRDPYFEPWYDTAQLDYTNPELRERMMAVLKRIAKLADGVRCDMAMLLLRDYIRDQWYPNADGQWFDERMPGEFWAEAINATKASKPGFLFIAEAYWDKELELLNLGFDLAYEKQLYDGLVARDLARVTERLARTLQALSCSLNFIENHDEPRAAEVLSREFNVAAAALMLSLPGATLIHEGQMEGKRERLPVQRLKPLVEEPVDHALQAEYRQLLEITSMGVFQTGSFALFDAGAPGVVSFIRQTAGRTVMYAGRISDASPRFASVSLEVSAVGRLLDSPHQLRARNMITSQSKLIYEQDGQLRLDLLSLVPDDSEYCLLDVTSD